jgi:phospholipid/cholesterol/gamma-HCH transport system substrate-binding protein
MIPDSHFSDEPDFGPMKSRLEWKVGLFVLIGLVLLAVLLIQFSKGVTFFHSTYDIYLRASNVGGLKTKAAVRMSGVQVGTVSDISLAPGGTSVTITLRVFGNYIIHRDARFVIEQSGFLGDQYVAIVPIENKEPPFKDQDTAQAEAPFNLQEFTRSASGFITRIDETIKKLNDSLADVTRVLLNPQTLTNLAVTAANLRTVSDRAMTTFANIDNVVATNAPSLTVSVSNFVFFSEQLNRVAADARAIIATNSGDINRTVKNLEDSSESLKLLMSDVHEGKGLAGKLISNEQLASKATEIANQLSVTTSNLNRLGLWRILWQHKLPKTNEPPARPLNSPKAGE